MSELVEFIRGCLDADEQTARAAMVVIGDDFTEYRIAEWWEKPEHSRVYAGHWHPVVQSGETHGDPVFYNTAALPHIARHDPARVLAEVNAKRAILGLHADVDYGTFEGIGAVSMCRECRDQRGPCNTVRALAECFRGEPGWRDEWGTNGHKEAQG